MNQMKKQLLTAVMAFAIAASCTAPAFAADTAVSPAGSASSATEIMPRSYTYRVVSDSAPLRATPGEDGKILTHLKCNTVVYPMGDEEYVDGCKWLYMRCNNGYKGWLSINDIVLNG